MEKWEYWCKEFHAKEPWKIPLEDIQDSLNQAGEDGWELVSSSLVSSPDFFGLFYILKRPKDK